MNILTEYFFKNSTNIFTLTEVAVAINGSANRRNGLIKRAIANGEILNIRRGLYCLAPEYQKTPVSTFSLAQKIYGPSYISLESALSFHHWIPEAVYTCTCACLLKSKEFATPLGNFSFTRIPQKLFFESVERFVDDSGNVSLMASPAKALADYVYVHKPPWKTIRGAAESLRIESEDLFNVKKQELQALLKIYKNRQVKEFLTSWEKEMNL
jgi:predicted transcriptional regulator of viral defense system